MKLGVKLIAGFFIISLLLVFVGYFGITSNNTIQKDNQIGQEIRELMEELDDLFIDILQLIKTENLDDYRKIKSNIENTRKEFDVLHEKNDQTIHNIVLGSFDAGIKEFTKISNSIIVIHKEKLVQDGEFDEKYTLEKEGRYNIRIPLFTIDDRELTEDVGFMQYYSKETLYQKRDQKTLDEWLGSIEKIKSKIETLNLSQEKKNDLLNQLNLYKLTAQSMGEIVIEQKSIEAEELLKVEQLREIIDELEDDEDKIVGTIHSETESLAQNTARTLLIVIIIAFIGSVVLGLLISNSISKPIQELTKASQELKKGNLNYEIKIKSKDEIGELAETFNEMRMKLKERESLAIKDRNELLNSILNSFTGKFGNIAVILMRKNIQDLVNKNPRIMKMLPKEMVETIKKGEELKKKIKKEDK